MPLALLLKSEDAAKNKKNIEIIHTCDDVVFGCPL